MTKKTGSPLAGGTRKLVQANLNINVLTVQNKSLKHNKSMKLIACCNLLWDHRRRVVKTFLIMKMMAVFILVIGLNASAKSFSQTVTLSKDDVPLEKVFKEISRQTGYTFVYTKSLMQHATG